MNHSTVASGTSKRRFDKSRVTRLSTHPEGDANLVIWALQRGLPFRRPLTRMERLSLGVASTEPTHHLILGTSGMAQPELAAAFGLFVPKVECRKHKSGPLIYFGAYAQGKGDGGRHAHILLWEEPFYKSYMAQARSVGIDNCIVRPITNDPYNTLRVAQYVFGQQEPVFGSRKHEENEPREKHKRGFISNQGETLRAYHPELLRVTEMAKDQSVSDVALVSSLPLFIRNYRQDFSGLGDVQTAA